MAMLTASLLGAEIKDMRFVFSVSALRDSAVYFGVTFLLILAFNIVMVRRQKLIDLIYADRKNERFKAPSLGVSALIFVVSLICLGIAYMIATFSGLDDLNGLLPLAIGMGVAGTFLFFFSLSGFFLKLFRRNRKLYLSNLNMFVLRQINSKINTAYVSMTFVCLMLFISICALSSGVGMANAISSEMRSNTPFDATLIVGANEDDETEGQTAIYAGTDLAAALRENGVDIDGFARERVVIRYYDAGVLAPLESGGETAYVKTRFIGLSDYNALLKMQGAAPISLDEDEYAVDSAMTNKWPDAINRYMSEGHVIEAGGKTLRTDTSRFYRQPLETAANWNFNLAVVVNDDIVRGLPVKNDIMHVNYIQGDDGVYETLCRKSLLGMRLSTEDGGAPQVNLTTKAQVMETSNSATTTVAYLAVYLGIVFLIASATVLAIAQLSETSDNVRRYGLLRKIGTDDRMLNGALTAQISIYFGVPLGLALIHSFVGINMANKLIGALGDMSILGGVFAAVVILIVYGGYFLATCTGARSMMIDGAKPAPL
jgi:putative ABC transport system permease protein